MSMEIMADTAIRVIVTVSVMVGLPVPFRILQDLFSVLKFWNLLAES